MAENDNFIRGFRDIPDDAKIKAMSFIELVEALSQAKRETTLFLALDREHKKRLGRDAAQINLRNVLIGGVLAGCFGLVGVVLGWYLRDSQPTQQAPSSGTAQQDQKNNLATQPKVVNLPSVPSVASQPVAMPSSVRPDAKSSQARP